MRWKKYCMDYCGNKVFGQSCLLLCFAMCSEKMRNRTNRKLRGRLRAKSC